MAEVILSSVTKKFGPVTAVRDLSLTVGDGEFVVLLGPTGAGKTTTLRLVSGLERADSGKISIAGIDVTRLEPAARDVAMVFQQFSLYPHYTVYDNLAFPLRSPLRRLPEPQVEERVRQVAALLRIEPKLGNKATHLSGGEMQRVAIGRALVREPAVFLMDEPLSSLDAKLRADLRIEMKRIQLDLGATILYVTHDQVEAMTMADRGLARGRAGADRHAAPDLCGTRQPLCRQPPRLAADQRAAGGIAGHHGWACRRRHDRGPARGCGAGDRRRGEPGPDRRAPGRGDCDPARGGRLARSCAGGPGTVVAPAGQHHGRGHSGHHPVLRSGRPTPALDGAQ